MSDDEYNHGECHCAACCRANQCHSPVTEANRARVRAELDRADVLERGKRFGSR